MPEQLYDDGWEDIVSIDFSEEAIAASVARCERQSAARPRPGLRWAVADATELGQGLPSQNGQQPMEQWKEGFGLTRRERFDVVLDKGLFDALLLSPPHDEYPKEDSHNYSQSKLEKLSSSMHRCLRPGGAWIMWSLSGPQVVGDALGSSSPWNISVMRIPKAYFYVAVRPK